MLDFVYKNQTGMLLDVKKRERHEEHTLNIDFTSCNII